MLLLKQSLAKYRKGIISSVCVLLSTAAGSIYMVPNLFHNHYAEITVARRFGGIMEVPDSVTELIEKVQDDIQFTPKKKRSVRFFLQSGVACFNVRGITFQHAYYVIGLPLSIIANRPIDLSVHKMQIHDREIDWNSYEAEALKESLVLSEPCKKFCLAEAMLSINNYKCWLTTITFVVGLYTSLAFNQEINRRYNLHRKTVVWRVPGYAAMTALFTCWGIFTAGMITRSYEKSALLSAAFINDDYRKAAMDYQEKCLERNIALRKISPAASYFYKEDGDETFLARRLHLSVKERIHTLNSYNS